MRSRWIWTVALLACCSEPPAPEPPAGDAVASWESGAVTLPELEERLATARTPACLAARATAGGGSLEELVPCYREVAEGLALERLILAEVGDDLDRAIAELEGYELLRGQAYLAAHLRRLGEEIEISDAEIERHFEAHRERYRRPGAVRLWNIFRRDEEGGRPEETLELLRRVKERYEAGETFDALAREVSQSQTRARGGLVGLLRKGVLPARLEEIAFALEDGEVSDPIRVKGGAVLLHVRNVVEEVPYDLEQVRQGIRQELMTSRIDERIAARADGVDPPPSATLLGLEELWQALDAGPPERVVLEIAGPPLTLGELRQMAELGAADRAADLPEPTRQQLETYYLRQRDRQLLMLELVDSAAPELRREAEEGLREVGISRLVDERLREEMLRLVDGDRDRLRLYWEDNRHHYQSPLRFDLEMWNLPFDDDPPAQLLRMERLRESLAAGELDLQAAAAALGGRVEDLGWKEYTELAQELSPTALAHLLELGEAGFTPPYHLDGVLHLIWLERREEPAPLEYEEARDLVREDYLARFQRELFRRALESRLAAAGFVFDEAEVRRRLVPPGAASPAGS